MLDITLIFTETKKWYIVSIIIFVTLFSMLVEIFPEVVISFIYVVLCSIWYHLHNLKMWKTPMEECYF